MAVRIDAKEFFELFDATPASQNIMLVGRHGIGKSQIVTEYFRARSMQVVPFFLGQMSDPGDLIGLLHKNEQSGRSEFLPPFWWPTDGQPIVLFLDELNRARPEVLQSVMELALNKSLAGRELPAGSIVVAAVNDGDEYQLTELDPALVSRFNLYEFAPTIEDWMTWAEKHGIDQRVIFFLSQSPQFLDGDGKAMIPDQMALTGLVKTPDRRGWARVSDLILPFDSIDDTRIKMIAGIIGSAAANAFRKSLTNHFGFSAAELLNDYSRYEGKLNELTLAELLSVNDQILVYLSAPACDTDQAESVRESLLSYVELLRKRKYDEVVAHFVAQLEKPRFEPVMGFIAESMQLTELLTKYMEGIRVE